MEQADYKEGILEFENLYLLDFCIYDSNNLCDPYFNKNKLI